MAPHVMFLAAQIAATEPTSADPTWVTILIAVIASGGVFGAFGSLVTARSQKAKMGAEAVQALTGAAINMINELQEQVDETKKEAREARKESYEAREELRGARRQIWELSDEVDALTVKVRAARIALSAPHVSVPGLRALFGVEPGGESVANGGWHG